MLLGLSSDEATLLIDPLIQPEEQEQVTRPNTLIPQMPLGGTCLAQHGSPVWVSGKILCHQIWV
jgi:hypothetical protein